MGPIAGGAIGGTLRAILMASFTKRHKGGWAVIGIVLGGGTGMVVCAG